MAENILRGIIKIEAPGVEQAANKTASAVGKVEQSLKKVAPASNQATGALINLGRVVQDAPFGFLGIANNLNPLLESFQRTGQAAGGFGAGLKAVGKSLLGAGGIGLALSAVSSALILFGDSIFGSSKKVNESEESLKRYKESIDQVTDSLAQLKSEVSSLNQLGTINIKIAGLPEVLDLQAQSIAATEFVQDVQAAYNDLIENITRINNDATLSDEDRAEALKENAKAIRQTEKELRGALRAENIAQRSITLQKIKDAKEDAKKQLELQKDFVNKTIARGKELARFFEGRREVPFFSIFDTKSQQFDKAFKFINEVETGVDDIAKSKFQVPLNIEPIFKIEKADIVKQFREAVKEIQKTVSEGSTGLQDLKLQMPVEIQVKLKNQEQAIAEANKLQDAYLKIGQNIQSAITPAINGIIDAVSSGEGVLRSFANGIANIFKNLLAKLIAIAAAAAAISLISGGASGGGLGFLGAFKKLLGGGISGLSPAGGVGGSGFGGGISVVVSGQLVGRGNDLVAVVTGTSQSQGRAFIG
jgi:tetratricopeptide (TPR) repeat protein